MSLSSLTGLGRGRGWRLRKASAVAGFLLGTAAGVSAVNVDWDGGTASVNTATGGNTNTAANWGASGGGANGAAGGLPAATDDVLLQDVAGSGVTRTVTLNAVTAWQSLSLLQSTATNTNLFYVGVGGASLTLTGATPLVLSGTASATAKFDLTGGNTVALSNAAIKTVTFGSGTVLAGNAVGSGQGLYNTAAAATTFAFTGGTISTGTSGVNVGGGAGSANNNLVSITAPIGPAASTSNLLKITNVPSLTLNWSGTLDLGATVARRDTGTGTVVTIASTATGMSGGIVLASHPSGQLYPAGLGNFGDSSLIFTAGGTGFNLAGGTLDVRANTAASGVITQNNVPLTISGGSLLGNVLASNSATPASLTVTGGELALRAETANYTIAASGGTDNRTLNMSGGTFSAARTTAGGTITVPAQASGGTWNLGLINADANYTITGGFASGLATYTVAANSGPNGLAMGAIAIPTTLTLGSGATFYAATSTAAGRTYNIGTGGGDDIKVPASGAFTFGLSNGTGTQVMNLNRDKGADSINLINNGNLVGNEVVLAANQTGAGNLTINARKITLPGGITFGGTGGIYQSAGLTNNAGTVNGSGNIGCTFNLNGAINGTNTVFLGVSENQSNQIVLGPTAVVGGTQTWTVTNNNIGLAGLDNQMTNAANWTNGAVTLSVTAQGADLEAATSTASPSAASNFKLARINFASGNSGQAHTAARFRNTTQNDGGVAGTKEAVYAAQLDFGGMSDSSGGHFALDLNGQDLYVDRFANVTNSGSRSLQFANSALNSISTVRALSTTGDPLIGGSFMVSNGATLEVVGGSWTDLVYSRHVGTAPPADTAAAPNSVLSVSVDTTRMWDSTAGSAAAMVHFLGSGSDKAGNGGSSYTSTGGTIRVVGGSYITSGYVLNPIGTTGVFDTTSANPNYPDVTLDNVVIRPQLGQQITAVSTVNGTLTAAGHRFIAGSPVGFPINAGLPTGFALFTTYYVVNPTATTFQLSATPGGAAIVPTTTGSNLSVTDPSSLSNASVFPALAVAGNTSVIGNLLIPAISGATASGLGGNVSAPLFQSVLRIGGTVPTATNVTADPATDILTLASGGVTSGQTVCLSGTTVPTGLTFGQVCYARDVAGSTFKIAAYPGGPAIDVTAAGSAVTSVTVAASGTATLIVTGDLTVESRTITDFFGPTSNAPVNRSISAMTGTGAVVTTTTSARHNLLPGDIVTIAGVTGGSGVFNGIFTVADVLSPTLFTYAATGSGTPTVTSASGAFSKSVSANFALQSNGTLKVGGNVAIGGVGLNQNALVTGLGVGISPVSSITLNGNSGAATPQTVSIAPTVGLFHVGDGSAGVLTGTAAQARLTANLGAAGNVDVNGVASSLSLNGNTLTLAAGKTLTVGGTLTGAGTVTGGTTSILGAAHLVPGSSAGVMTTAALGLDNLTVLDFELGDVLIPAASDRVDVLGGLTLDGLLNVTALSGFGIGAQPWVLYPLFTYSNLLADNGVTLASLPPGYGYSVFTTTGTNAGPGQVLLLVPEPTSVLLLAVGLLGLRRGRRT